MVAASLFNSERSTIEVTEGITKLWNMLNGRVDSVGSPT